jgi:hypothetical protein
VRSSPRPADRRKRRSAGDSATWLPHEAACSRISCVACDGGRTRCLLPASRMR